MALEDGERTWRIGDKIRIRAVKVDWKNRWIDFASADCGKDGCRAVRKGRAADAAKANVARGRKKKGGR